MASDTNAPESVKWTVTLPAVDVAERFSMRGSAASEAPLARRKIRTANEIRATCGFFTTPTVKRPVYAKL
jgi:hypothetical protein